MEDQTSQEQNQQTQENQPVIKPDEASIRAKLAGKEDIEFSIDEKDTESPERPADQPQENEFEGATTDDIKTQIPDESAAQAKPDQGAPTDGESVFNPAWSNIQKMYEEQFGPNTFKKPEGITKENEFDVLLGFLQANLEPSLEGIPEEAREIIELDRKGAFNPDEYFKNRSSSTDYLKLPAYDFLFQMYRSTQGKSDQNPDGHTEEEIHEFLKGMNKIQLKELADQKKAGIAAHREQTKTQREQQLKDQSDQQFQTIQKQKEDQAKAIVNQFGKSNDFFGIEPSPEDKSAYDRDFVEMVKLNPETGTSKLYDMLQDDGLLYKVGYYVWKGENLRGYLTQMKESVKKNIESKLDPTLEKEKGSTKLRKPVDRGKLV